MRTLLSLGIVLMLVSLVVGCVGTSPGTVPSGGSTESGGSGVVNYDIPGGASTDSGLWLRGAEVFIKDLYPGCCPDAPMEFEVGNGVKDGVVREVYVSITAEDDADLKGYEQLPPEYYDWFTIDLPFFVLQPGGSQVIHVTVVMPEGTDYSGKKARCQLLVLGYTVVGTTVDENGAVVNEVSNIPIGVASEWYIETY